MEQPKGKIGKMMEEMVAKLIKQQGDKQSSWVVAGVIIEMNDLRRFLSEQHGPEAKLIPDEVLMEMMAGNGHTIEVAIKHVVYTIIAAAITIDHSGN